jgi:hypothetical protein
MMNQISVNIIVNSQTPIRALPHTTLSTLFYLMIVFKLSSLKCSWAIGSSSAGIKEE